MVALDPKTRHPEPVAAGFKTPLGLAWLGRSLYVSGQGRLERLTLAGGRLRGRRAILAGLPFGLHQQDNVVVGRDGRLYASVNGRDDLDRPGDPEPAEMIVAIRPGANYGWPGCWPSARTVRLAGDCRGVEQPAAYFEPHSSADGIAFYTGASFPPEYRGNLFVAEWGTYFGHRFGQRVVRVILAPNGRESKVSAFAAGFEHPLALIVDPQGALLVADFGRGTITRIQAQNG